MDIATILIGFSELAIALAGFTTIATIIVRVSNTTSKNLLAVRLKMVLMFSILLIVIAITPLVLYQLNPESERIWHWSALVFLIFGGLAILVGFFDLLPRTLRDPKHSWWQTLGSSGLGTASMVTGVVTLLGDNPVFWYTTTLALVLGTCLVMLAGLVLSFPVFDVHRENH